MNATIDTTRFWERHNRADSAIDDHRPTEVREWGAVGEHDLGDLFGAADLCRNGQVARPCVRSEYDVRIEHGQ